MGINHLMVRLKAVKDGDGLRTRIMWKVRQAFQALEAEKGARLRPVGLRSAHYSLMINIAETPGLSGAELARRLSVAPQNVAALASRLEREGLLERRAHQRHAHVQELYLTAQGQRVISAADEVVGALEADIVALLGDEDAAHLRRILANLVDGLTRTGAPPTGAEAAIGDRS
jgi:DNA-binding MarR family transcriptional regulator